MVQIDPSDPAAKTRPRRVRGRPGAPTPRRPGRDRDAARFRVRELRGRPLQRGRRLGGPAARGPRPLGAAAPGRPPGAHRPRARRRDLRHLRPRLAARGDRRGHRLRRHPRRGRPPGDDRRPRPRARRDRGLRRGRDRLGGRPRDGQGTRHPGRGREGRRPGRARAGRGRSTRWSGPTARISSDDDRAVERSSTVPGAVVGPGPR